jgi:hypothetical protein
MHDFEQIKTHPSYARLPLTVREVLRMAFNDPNLDLLAALRGVSPRAARATLDIQLDTLKKLLSHPEVQTLTVLWTFGLDLHVLRGAPDAPISVELV